ncbi:MAG TPA: hypothetical protein VF533_08265 [Solirubrobacteraceae bacterium]|jgi:tetratricopeptide (TPR) repeat protein
MPRSEYSSARRAPTVFLNRYEELRLVGSHVDLLRADPTHFKVFEVIGLGGVGKTRLLQEMRRRTAELSPTGHLIWVALEAEAFATETGPLRAIREQLPFDCLLFDTALLTYWNSTGQPFQVSPASRVAQSLIFKSVEAGGGVAGIPLPLTFAADVWRSIGRHMTKRRHYQQQDFEAIDELRLDPSAIRARLPHWLGVDIRRRLDLNAQTLVVFYDGYDKQSPATLSANAPWLRELTGTVDRGVHVIAARERLRWNEADWGSIVQTVIVDDLPEPEARDMIRSRLGVLAPELERRLLDASNRIPFFLEAAIDAYDIQSQGAGPPALDALPSSPRTAVSHLIDHLPEGQRSVAIALATVQTFDAGLYRHLVRALNLPISVLELEDCLAWFFVEPVSPGLHKTHDLLTAFVRASPVEAGDREASLVAATTYLLTRSADNRDQADAILPILRGLIAGWRSVATMPIGSTEALLDVGYRLHDLGYWQELATTLPSRREDGAVAADHPAVVAAEFFSALAARRTTGVGDALERFERLEPRLSVLGRHARSARLEAAYLSELAGNYGRARSEFARLSRGAQPFDPTDRTHVRSRLYHADMLSNDGLFQDASRLLLEAYEFVGHRAPLDWAELVRHRGHAFRFSFLHDQAADLYRLAIQAAADAPALAGKLQTNFAETYCWCEPDAALEAAALSIEVSTRLGNRIEIAKCEAARAIALAKLGELAAARQAVVAAEREARSVGYPAGVAFALRAQGYVEAAAGNLDGVLATDSALGHHLESLGTYAHLRAATAWLTRDDGRFVDAAIAVDWLQPEGLDDRLRSALTP